MYMFDVCNVLSADIAADSTSMYHCVMTETLNRKHPPLATMITAAVYAKHYVGTSTFTTCKRLLVLYQYV